MPARKVNVPLSIPLAGLLLLARASFAAPRTECANPEFDFGVIASTDVVTHVFQVRNAGDEVLNMPVVRGACGCTTGSISRTSLAPGETAEVTAVFRPEGRTGPQDRKLTVHASDTNLTLTLRGRIRRDFVLTPEQLLPGLLRADRPTTLSLEFENFTPDPVRVTNASASSPHLDLSVVEQAAGRKYRIDIRTRPPLPRGPMLADVRIHTDSALAPVLHAPINADVLGPLVVVPSQLVLGASTAPVSRFIIINPGLVTNFSVVRVELPDPAMTSQQVKFGTHGVRVMVNHIVAGPELAGKSVRIITDAEEQKELVVPFIVRSAAEKP